MRRSRVRCFSVNALVNFNDREASYDARFYRSRDVRSWIKECLKDPDVTSMVVTIAREARDPVENTAS